MVVGLLTEEEGVEAAVGEVLVHRQLLVALDAPSEEAQQVGVLQLGDELHLVPGLRRTLPRPRRQPLRSDSEPPPARPVRNRSIN